MVSYVLERAVAEGKLKPGGTIVAATSGNTGASEAALAAPRGRGARGRGGGRCRGGHG